MAVIEARISLLQRKFALKRRLMQGKPGTGCLDNMRYGKDRREYA
jgi:hypothetical protein